MLPAITVETVATFSKLQLAQKSEYMKYIWLHRAASKSWEC